MEPEGEDPDTRRPAEALVGGAVAAVLSDVVAPPTELRVTATRDRITVLIFGTRTSMESTLLEAGNPELIQRERDALREVMSERLRRVVGAALGLRVVELTGSHDAPSGTETLLFRLARSASAC